MVQNSLVKNRIFWLQLAKFLLVALVLLAVYIPVLIQTLRATEDNAVAQTYNHFESASSQINRQMTELLVQGDLISSEIMISRITNMRDEMKHQDYYVLMQAQKVVQNSIMGSDLVSGAYIISRNNDMLISNSLILTERSEAYGEFYAIDGYSLEQWEEAVFEQGSGYHFIPDAVSNPIFAPWEGQSRSRILHFVLPISVNGASARRAVVYMLDTEKLIASLLPEAEGSFFYISDQNGNVIVRENFVENPIEADENIAVVRHNGQSYVLLKSDYSDTGLSVTAGLPSSFFTRQVAPMRNLMLVLSVVVWAIIFLLCALLAYRQSRPMKKLFEVVQELNPSDTTRDHYEHITNTVVMLEGERQRYEKEVQLMSSASRKGLLKQLIRGQVYGEDDAERCRVLLGAGNSRYLVCMYHFQGYPEHLAADLPDDELKVAFDRSWESLSGGLRRELNLEAHPVHGNPSRGRFVLAMPDESLFPAAVELIDRHVRILRGDGIPISLGISTVVDDLKGIRICSDRSAMAMRDADEEHPAKVYDPDKTPITIIQFSPNMGKRLYDLLLNGDLTAVRESIVGMLPSEAFLQYVSEVELEQFFFGVRGAVESAGRALSLSAEATMLPDSRSFVEPEELWKLFEIPCQLICESVQTEQSRQAEQQQSEMVEYVRVNYSDSGLCALTIAEHFSVSEKYVFTIIKNQTGMSLGDFIEQLRFTKVEELLTNNVEIGAIPGIVGFNSINTFYKAFKRIYGISPGKWRENAQTADIEPVEKLASG